MLMHDHADNSSLFLCYIKSLAIFVLRPLLGSFREGTRGNGVPVVKVSKNAKNASDCRILNIQSRKFSREWYTPGSRQSSPVLEPKHQFPLGSLTLPSFLFHETTTVSPAQQKQLLCYTCADAWQPLPLSAVHTSLVSVSCQPYVVRPESLGRVVPHVLLQWPVYVTTGDHKTGHAATQTAAVVSCVVHQQFPVLRREAASSRWKAFLVTVCPILMRLRNPDNQYFINLVIIYYIKYL